MGEWVWRYYPRRIRGRSEKWSSIYDGPWLVVGIIPPVNYVIKRPVFKVISGKCRETQKM